MAAPARSARATAMQRLYIRTLMNARELPTHIVTVMHRDIFKRNGVDWRDGQDMDELLVSLDQRQIDGLIRELRDDEENDDA